MIHGIYDSYEDAKAGIQSEGLEIPEGGITLKEFLAPLFPKSDAFYRRRMRWCAWFGHWEYRLSENAIRCRCCHQVRVALDDA